MDKAAFKKQIEVGRKFERKVQTLLETHSPGQVFRNVQVGTLCEFDVVVEDYPVISFVEIKRYREDFKQDRVRMAIRKFRKNCTTVTTNADTYDRTWLPYRNKRNERDSGEVTYFELLLNKLNIQQTEGWRFRMILIVPHEVYYKVIVSLAGYSMNSNKGIPKNLIDIDGIPLLIVRDTAIEGVFS